MAEQKNSMPPRRPGGPGHGPRSHGYQRPQDLRGTVKKLLHYVGRYKGLLVLVAICLLLSSVGSVASSYFLKPAINNYILPGDFAGLLKLLVLMGLVFVLSALCSYVYSRIMVRVSQRTVAALRQDLFDKLQGLPWNSPQGRPARYASATASRHLCARSGMPPRLSLPSFK